MDRASHKAKFTVDHSTELREKAIEEFETSYSQGVPTHTHSHPLADQRA
jgi:hypothetical protein